MMICNKRTQVMHYNIKSAQTFGNLEVWKSIQPQRWKQRHCELCFRGYGSVQSFPLRPL